ncbi:hypothetical protein JMUB7505_27100 [Staphylococcus aureus]
MYTWGIWQSQIFQDFLSLFTRGHKKTKCHTFVTQYIAFVTVL